MLEIRDIDHLPRRTRCPHDAYPSPESRQDASSFSHTGRLATSDTGLAANLLGIDGPGQVTSHPLRGALFENWVATEIWKGYSHRGRRPRMYFYQERGRLEIDFILEQGAELIAIEVKAGRTPSTSYFKAFPTFEGRIGGRKDARWRLGRKVVVYGGTESQDRRAGELMAWSDLPLLDLSGGTD